VLGTIDGRVLHAECRTGALVELLVGAGAVAYGVEPRRELLVDASRRGLDVRPDEALEHLRRLPEHSLAAVVLSGAIDTAPLAQQLELLDHAVRVTRSGGRIVIASADKLDPIVADLALGHPLGRGTWTHLLAVRGCGDARVAHESTTSFVVIASRAA
jgi:SAM-dependent methyltransferase